MSANLKELLQWIAAANRTYGETMAAWRSSCPRLTIWEDALTGGYVQVESCGSRNDAKVTLTEAGEEALR